MSKVPKVYEKERGSVEGEARSGDAAVRGKPLLGEGHRGGGGRGR